MANEKKLNTRIQQKHDTKVNWEQAINFAPKDGEIIIYDDLKKIKIGLNQTNVSNLPFIHVDWTEVDTKPSSFPPSQHSHNKKEVGLPNVENKSSETIRKEITKENVTSALGYTPMTSEEINSAISSNATVVWGSW